MRNKTEILIGGRLSDVILYIAIGIIGVALVAIIAITRLNWYIPTIAYGVYVYIAWQRFFGQERRNPEIINAE